LEMVSVDVREVIVAGWWCGWELCSELGSFGSTDIPQIICCVPEIGVNNEKNWMNRGEIDDEHTQRVLKKC